jgi:hypothetical protein
MTHALVARINRLPWTAIILGVALLAVVAWYLDNQSAERTEAIIQGRIDGCERGKTRDIALALAAQTESDYKLGVLAAASVQQDVKSVATVAQQQWARTAKVARARLVLCEPLIRHSQEVPDRQALREAKGGT